MRMCSEVLLADLKRDRQVRHPRYTLVTKVVDHLPSCSILEEWDSESSVGRVSKWTRARVPLIAKLPIEIFNRDIDFTRTSTTTDLERINNGLAREATRFEYFAAAIANADSADLRAVAAGLLDNAMSIAHHLRQASLLLVDTPSRKWQFEASVATMQKECATLGHMGVKSPVALKTLPGFERIGGTPAFGPSSWRGRPQTDREARQAPSR